MDFYLFICETWNWEQDVRCTQPAVLVQEISSIGERGKPCHVHMDHEQNFPFCFVCVSVAERCLQGPVSNTVTPSWHIWWHEKGRAGSWGIISKVTLICSQLAQGGSHPNISWMLQLFSIISLQHPFGLFSRDCFHTITSYLFPFFFISSHVVAIITCQNPFLFFLRTLISGALDNFSKCRL